jgi:hypothetical protein
MGMFDYVQCEVPLPDGLQPIELQTKDFECDMVVHVITKDGRLMMDCGHNEMVPLMERPYWKPEWGDSASAENEHPWEAICGSMRHVPKYEDASFHGIINFYGRDGDNNWHEYNAKFTDGQLVKIEVVSEPAS